MAIYRRRGAFGASAIRDEDNNAHAGCHDLHDQLRVAICDGASTRAEKAAPRNAGGASYRSLPQAEIEARHGALGYGKRGLSSVELCAEPRFIQRQALCRVRSPDRFIPKAPFARGLRPRVAGRRTNWTVCATVR